MADALARRETSSPSSLIPSGRIRCGQSKNAGCGDPQLSGGAGSYSDLVLTAQVAVVGAGITDIAAANRTRKPHHPVQSLGVGLETLAAGQSGYAVKRKFILSAGAFTRCNDIFLGKHVSLNGSFDEICTPGLSAGLPAASPRCPCSGKGTTREAQIKQQVLKR